MDSGSGHGLISAFKVDRMDLNTFDGAKVKFHTVNGITSTTSLPMLMSWMALLQCYHWENDVWNKVIPLFGQVAGDPT